MTLTKAASLCLDMGQGSWEWIHFYGRHAMERQAERRPLLHGIQESSSTRGTSSHHQNPTVLLCTPDCTETSGACVGAALVYSGSHQTKIECDQLGQVRVVMGIHPDLFRWELGAGSVLPHRKCYCPIAAPDWKLCPTSFIGQFGNTSAAASISWQNVLC